MKSTTSLQQGLAKIQRGPALEEARAVYRRAAKLDPESPEALVGLGHYLYAVEDDVRGASEHFAKAITLCRDWLRETLLAQAKALTEVGRHAEAFDCLAEARWLERSDSKAANGASGKDILERLAALGQEK